MSVGFSGSPKLLKGALVELSERFMGPLPNIIVFQYTPTSLTRSLEVYNPFEKNEIKDEQGEVTSVDYSVSANAQPNDPPETFSLDLELDATDDLEIGDAVALESGVADRIAALEMLLYPQEGSLFGDLLGSVSVSLGGGGLSIGANTTTEAEDVPRRKVPILLLVWGPGRILPVRLTSFQVEEQAYSSTLYPIRAKVSLGIKVLSDLEIGSIPDSNSLSKNIALAAYKSTRKQKQVLASSNVSNTVQSILGMLPF